MQAKIRRSALLATAKIALGSSVVSVAVAACAGKAQSGADEAQSSRGGDSALEPRALAGSSGLAGSQGMNTGLDAGAAAPGAADAGSACVGEVALMTPTAPPGPSEAEYECCVAFVRAGAPDWGTPAGTALQPSAPYANCCRAIISAVDVDHARYAEASALSGPCCSGSGVDQQQLFQHQLCLPWGPPVPPALDWRAA